MDYQNNDGFKTRWGFILAAIGSAIGLGNIWRYPTEAYKNGGGSFLIPYLVAILIAGLPILILEFNLGNKYRGSAPQVFKKIHPKLEFIGWVQASIALIVPIYYSAIIAWIIFYLFQSFTLGWGADHAGFFYNDFLNSSEIPTQFNHLGGINILIAVLITIVWIIVGSILVRGISSGIERVNKVMVPLLLVLFAIVVIYSLTLDGALLGLEQFFKPQWNEIANGKIWLAAFTQVFFSTSIAAGIMITYSSYVPKDSDLNTNAIITGLSNSSVEILAGFGVFAVLGFLATQGGVAVNDVVESGPGLVFTVYPAALSQFPAGIGNIIGILFYIALFCAGISSLISLVEVVVSAIKDKFNVSRVKATTIIVILGWLASLVITTNAGLYVLDIIDYFSNNLIWAVSGLLEIVGVFIALAAGKKLFATLSYGNEHSTLKVNPKILSTILTITAIILFYTIITTVISQFTDPYGGYSGSFLVVWGWGTVIFTVIVTIIFTLLKGSKEVS